VIALGAAAFLLLVWRPGAATIRREPGLSVLLVSVDTLRADALGIYGHPRAATPWIDRLAREGVRFEAAHAHNVVTLPSHANLLSGQLPLAHGIRDNSGFRFPSGQATLATLLRAKGYRTGAFVSAFPLDSRFGLDAGFDVYDDRLGGSETRSARAFLVPERSGAKTVAAARIWLENGGPQPALAFVHLYEPHFPYQPPEPFASRFRDDPYAGEVSATDAALEPLLRPLLEAGKSGRTLVVLTSDHGEALGDHGEETHGIFAYEATLRVPLVIYAPRILSPRVVRTPVRHVDVLPTVLDALGLPVPEGLPGRSLLQVMAGGEQESPPPHYFEALSASLNQGWAPLRGVRHGDLKYVDLPIPELYDVVRDPNEQSNLAATRPQELERLRALLSRLREGERALERVAEEATVTERLRALGYVSGSPVGPKERYGEQDDPKRLVELDRAQSEVVRLFHARAYDEAAALGRRILEERPDSPLAWSHLASVERARGDLAAAIEASRRAVALRPTDAEAAAFLAVYLVEAGRPREALALVEPFLAAEPPDPDVLTAEGMALAGLGRREQALAAFARAAAADANDAMALVNAATVHLLGGDLEKARERFEAALAVDADVARAWNGLGVIAASQNRAEEAIGRWKEAVRLDPGDHQALFNLGLTLRRLGRADEARPYFEAYLRTAPSRSEARDLARVRAWLAPHEGRR
jgi:arylsulfatase A-like enzyme/Flp pilus assembly protein TadD